MNMWYTDTNGGDTGEREGGGGAHQYFSGFQLIQPSPQGP